MDNFYFVIFLARVVLLLSSSYLELVSLNIQNRFFCKKVLKSNFFSAGIVILTWRREETVLLLLCSDSILVSEEFSAASIFPLSSTSTFLLFSHVFERFFCRDSASSLAFFFSYSVLHFAALSSSGL